MASRKIILAIETFNMVPIKPSRKIFSTLLKKLRIISIPIMSRGWTMAIKVALKNRMRVVVHKTRILNANAKAAPNKLDLSNVRK